MNIDWQYYSAEEILAAFKPGPIVMSDWQHDRTLSLWSRFALVFPDGCSKHACVQRTMIRGMPITDCPFSYSLGYAPGDYKNDFGTADAAMKAADEEMRRRGWKLVGDPPPTHNHCNQCGHEWPGDPNWETCPACKSPD